MFLTGVRNVEQTAHGSIQAKPELGDVCYWDWTDPFLVQGATGRRAREQGITQAQKVNQIFQVYPYV